MRRDGSFEKNTLEAAARDQPPDEGPSDARVEGCDAPVYTSTEAACAVDLGTRPPTNSRLCSPHGLLLSWPRGGYMSSG